MCIFTDSISLFLLLPLILIMSFYILYMSVCAGEYRGSCKWAADLKSFDTCQRRPAALVRNPQMNETFSRSQGACCSARRR